MNACVTGVPMQGKNTYFFTNLAEQYSDILVRHMDDLHAAIKTLKNRIYLLF
ncbi:MAG: hypothetical protein DID92_2727744951 [Candidatus Nitrotoga sp. SPKER]|nr:MAG: hypothetical protein DID92_2727744951 [Candidatus Nitrotoga sp. SPKER]